MSGTPKKPKSKDVVEGGPFARLFRSSGNRTAGGGSRSSWTYFAIAGTLACLLAGVLIAGCRRAAEEAREAAASYNRCRSLVVQIKSRMRTQPLLASPAPRDFEYGAAIKRAAEAAGITAASFPSPSLGAETPIGETRYVAQAVETGLGPVTLPQLITFLHKLATGDPAFQVRDIELTPVKSPAGSAEGEWWQPRLTLTYTSVSDGTSR